MRNPLITLLFFLVVLLVGHDVHAKSVCIVTTIPLQEQLNKPNTTYVIKETIDLKGNTLIMPAFSVLRFGKDGSIKNGTIQGDKTNVRPTRNNVFRNCVIMGSWNVKCAYSSMFDNDLDAMLLLKNLSCLSTFVKLSSKRNYHINASEELINVENLESDGIVKPVIKFHTTDPNVSGIRICGRNIRLHNLIIEDDYKPSNDAIYGPNNATIGNTIAILSRNGTIDILTIDNCDFRGGTSSSWVASSQTRNCFVKNCTFTGYMADHGVYCSMKAETFRVESCTIIDVTHVSGLFKVRTSDRLRSFSIRNVAAHNYNGYLAMVSLLETPEAVVTLDHITITKDTDNNSVFYGFCMNDETKNLKGRGYNASRISITNCNFGYGYDGNSVIYAGAGKSVCVKEVVYNKVDAKESNFGGGCSNRISVSNSIFNECSGDKGISLCTKELIIKTSKMNNRKVSNCLFLVNYDNDFMQKLSLQNVEIEANTNTLISIAGGDQIGLLLRGCNFIKPLREIYTASARCRVDYIKK